MGRISRLRRVILAMFLPVACGGGGGGSTGTATPLPLQNAAPQVELIYRNLHARTSADIKGASAILDNGYTQALWLADQLLYGTGLSAGELEKHTAE